jgi:hypothetical protein
LIPLQSARNFEPAVLVLGGRGFRRSLRLLRFGPFDVPPNHVVEDRRPIPSDFETDRSFTC